ncbi:RagB/SusD family nutrient uptake outer membrane protein [Emticicia sp. 21SJ11W-3]|uniref:RagB/SusD family nutrient uptake outer membrane protein n=1 Tax=Emticicia sp. 21SJ11W-3 TaxID=2916755 RepID=UPI00209E0561|nr:RagB/SusD family nutrient uptake outer membrane protein [Emticicia sp. 21SJ11W-3]UTA67553.1 RagB/SusD family nutrient uptake outer membrane protein [Emticicia sp. 21SJ11W-3]
MKKYLLLLILALPGSGCQEYLDAKPDKKLAVITSVKEAQTLLNNVNILNGAYPSAGQVASDEFYLLTADWLAVNTALERNAYIWQEEVFNENPRNDWSLSYQKVYYANLLLEGLAAGRIKGTLEETNSIKGQALFFRAYACYHLLQIFAPAWNRQTAATDPGIALRLSSDLNAPTLRASVEQGYRQLIEDARSASELLSVESSVKTRPSKVAAFALLARVYLTMGDYPIALEYAEKALTYRSVLIDFSTCNPAAAFPFPLFNEEVIFHSHMSTPALFYPSVLKVDSLLLKSYQTGDLRPQLFFGSNPGGSFHFKGSYAGSNNLFNGLTVGELMLIKAECQTRLNQVTQAASTLNALLQKRWKADLFAPVVVSDAQKLLDLVLEERRKELVFRGLRWMDLRRLNLEPERAVTIRRLVNNQMYALAPNSARYVFKIPQDVIAATGTAQNP